jgi:peptidoglycan/LPS O-acetylase OafA/YrhL
VAATARYAPLDGLRAVAVGLVFLIHADAAVFPGGFIGVDIFFALSGYIITTLLVQGQRRSGRSDLGGFYLRRFLRLVPALAVMVAVVTPVALRLGYGSIGDTVATMLFVQDIRVSLPGHAVATLLSHTWTLGVEEQFYLVLPALLVATAWRPARAARVLGAVVVACAIATAGLHHLDGETVTYGSPITHAPELACGALVALALGTESGRRRLSPLRHDAVPVVAVLAVAVALFHLDLASRWLYLGGWPLLGAAFAAVVAHLVLAGDGRAARTLSWGPLRWLGLRSYGFYLWHYPVLAFLVFQHDPLWTHFVIGLPVALALTEASWLVVETPCLRLKDRLSGPRRALVAQ